MTNWIAIDQELNRYVGKAVIDPSGVIRQLTTFEWTDEGFILLRWNNGWFTEITPDAFAEGWSAYRQAPIEGELALTLPQMFESGQVDQQMHTNVLESARELISQTVYALREGRWGGAGRRALLKYTSLLEQIQQVLNKRYGVDGMTPLAY